VIPGAPSTRARAANDRPMRPDGDYVLYWMVAARRTSWTFALQHALSHAQGLGLPLVVLEALRVGYPWASDRLHRFVLDGMADNRARFAGTPVVHHAYVEPEPGHGAGLLAALAERAAVVVTDTYPCFFLPRMVRAAAARLPVRLEEVDGNGLLPLSASERAWPTAYTFRRHLQRTLPAHLGERPLADPLAAASGLPAARLPASVLARWPAAADALLDGRDGAALAALPIDHGVPTAPLRGGPVAARVALERFLAGRLPRYGDARNHPDEDAASGLSPYLHFGHISAQEVAMAALAASDWHEGLLAPKASGGRAGWWGASASVEAFLDELVTWRELGFACCVHRPDDYDRYDALPAWALETLEVHAGDPRPWVYDRDALAAGRTHDPIWNAAQTQLLREGTIQNYLRMLWGKKILHWTRSPREAAEIMIHLNDRYALDGRDPNSYSGIFWCLGRYDRPWGPERPVFGKVRYMTSESTRRKLRMATYLRQYGPTRVES